MDAVCLVVKVVDSLFPKFSYKWLADEMADNLPLELNFLHEAENSRRYSMSCLQYPDQVLSVDDKCASNETANRGWQKKGGKNGFSQESVKRR